MNTPRHPDAPHIALLDRLVQQLAVDGHADARTRAAVDALTTAAAPDRADRLAVGSDDAPVLVERLAAWAAPRAPLAAIAEATALLDGPAPTQAMPTPTAELVAC